MSSIGMNAGATKSYQMATGETTLNQNCFAILDTSADGTVKRATGATVADEFPVGVLRDSSLAAGEIGNFQYTGIAQVAISAAVTRGDTLVIGNAAGQVKPKKGSGALTSGVATVGKALTSASSAGSYIDCLLTIGVEAQS